MKMFGRLEEHKASIYEANSNTDITLNSNAEIPIVWDWPALTLDEKYYYVVPYEWSKIRFIEAGVYQVNYGINSKQYTANSRDIVTAGLRVNGTQYKHNSISYSYIRNKTDGVGTNIKSFLVKIQNPEDYAELCVRRKYSSGLIKILGGENTITIQRLRPILPQDIL